MALIVKENSVGLLLYDLVQKESAHEYMGNFRALLRISDETKVAVRSRLGAK